MYARVSPILLSSKLSSTKTVMLTAGGWGITADDLPKTIPEFVELTDTIYRICLDGSVEDHVMNSLKMIADALEEDRVEIKFITNRMCKLLFLDILLRSL